MPAGHAVHATDPLADEKKPAGHCWQVALVAAPVALEKVPAGHSVQLVVPGELA